MRILQWEEVSVGTSKPFLKAEPVKLNVNFNLLCEGRFWGGSSFYFNLTFSIHERIIPENGFGAAWKYQLLAPNGIHVYCKDAEEAKEIAEIMCRRIFEAFSSQMNRQPVKLPEGEIAKKLNVALKSAKVTTENLNAVLHRKFFRNIKKKKEKLVALLKRSEIGGRLYYSRLPKCTGWMLSRDGEEPILIGINYEKAFEYIMVNFLNNSSSPALESSI